MKFFVDTADTAEIKSLAASGLLDGVTTNPSLVAKTGRKFLDVLAEICAVVPGPVSAEVAATDYDGMMAEARVLRAGRQERRRQGAADAGRAARLPPPDRRRRHGQRDAVLLRRPGDPGGQGRRHLRQPVRRPAGRYRRARHGADRRHRADLPQLSGVQDRGAGGLGAQPDARGRGRPRSAPTSPRCRRRCCARCSTTR